MPEEKANALLIEWQKRLFITEWQIELNPNCNPDDMDLDGLSGQVEYTYENKAARIDILDEKYYGSRVSEFDFEQILLHEMLHLKFCIFTDSGNLVQDRLIHQYIDEFARALEDAKRSG